MALFKKRSTDPEELERLKSEIAMMSARLEASDHAKSRLDSTVQGLVTRLDTPIPPPPSDAPSPTPTVDPAAIDVLNAKIQRLAVRIDDVGVAASTATVTVDPAEINLLNAKLENISNRIEEIDARITAVSTELANQISEISGEIESAGDRQPLSDEALDELRDAQTRLAGEQARYQIAFRQDLAEVVDRIKRA